MPLSLKIEDWRVKDNHIHLLKIRKRKRNKPNQKKKNNNK